MQMRKVSEELAVAWSEELDRALSGAAPILREEIVERGDSLLVCGREYRGSSERYLARWDPSARDGGRLRVLCRDFGEAGRSAPTFIRAIGRLFEWDGNAILTSEDDQLETEGHGWAFGSEFKLARSMDSVAKPSGAPGLIILDLDDEPWVLAAKEGWVLEKTMASARPQASSSSKLSL